MEFTGINYGITGTGKIYQPDILEVGIAGHITLNFTADLSCATSAQVVESWIYYHNNGTNGDTFAYSYHTFGNANVVHNKNAQIQFVATAGDQFFVILKTGSADTLTFKKFLLSVWC